jgi:periplasmic protein TonB
MSLSAFGKRSPLVKGEESRLRRAYYITNILIFLVILLSFLGIRYQQWRQERNKLNLGKRVIKMTYAQLGPPPSITGEESIPQTTVNRPSVPIVGTPKPVLDAEATQETAPTQQDIAGNTNSDTTRGDGIPDIDAFVPHEVEPKPLSPLKIKFPEAARNIGIEGTTFVKALIDLDGTVMNVVVLRGLHPIIDSAAVQGLYNAKYSPALQNGKPVRVWIMYPIRFNLSEQ